MSASITGLSDAGLTTRLLADSTSLKSRMDQLTAESASGLVSSTYSGLGSGGRVSLDLNPVIAAAQAEQTNISVANTRLSVTQNAMSQISAIASQFYTSTLSLTSQTSSEVDTVAVQAQQALQQVASLLDTQDGGVYVFAGQDTANPPVPDPENILNSNFVTQIQSAVAGLAANGGAATAAATLAAAEAPANSPFSATLGTQQATVQLAPGQTIPVGIIANQNATAVQTGTSTTGSYIVDLMRSLATLASLNGGQASLGQPFQDLLQDSTTSLTGVISAMATDTATLGSTQDELTSINNGLTSTVNALTTQVSDVQDVDMTTTATQLSQVQTQLQASYKLIADLSNFSLVTFMSSTA
ncbi:MAG TPA: flagellin [Acetobacteraceae bacterium]|nr:flagellin [Acetobacteraceae bacterium]